MGKEIPVADAAELLEICEPGVIEKIRYYIPSEILLMRLMNFTERMKD